jgi:hypothetical protein
MDYELKVGADCAAAGVIEARWDAKRADGALMHQYVSRWNKPDVRWNVFDTESLAPRTWQPVGATTGTDAAVATSQPSASQTADESTGQSIGAATTVPQNAPTTDIRMGSDLYRVSVPLTEVCKEDWKLQAKRYAVTPHGLINWGAAAGNIQKLPQGATGWSVVTSFTTDTNGQFYYKIPYPSVPTKYRAVIYDTQYIFGDITFTYDMNPQPGC